MARTKVNHQSIIYGADAQCMELMANYICDQEAKGEGDPELAKDVVKEAMTRLSVHGLDLFDGILSAVKNKRKEGGA